MELIINKDVLYDMYVATELGGNENLAYQINPKANTDSGYTFGQCQWDLLTNPGSRPIFKNILETATDSNGDLIFDTNKDGQMDDTEQARIEDIMNTVKTAGGNFDATQKNLVNQALQSDEGYNKINETYDNYLDNKLTRLNNLLGELDASGAKGQATADSIRENPILQLLILDYDNKFPGKNGGVDGINNPGNYTTSDDGALMKLLKNGETTINGQIVKVDGDFDVEDFLEFLFKTKEANKISDNYSGAKDLLRRLAAIIDLTEIKYGMTEEEWKIVDGLLGLKALGLNGKDLLSKLRSLFNIGATVISPIILDLDKDGVETTALTSGTYFDHDANGFSEQTGWASSDDGLLVMDRDADGLIEDGTELFGDNTILADGTNASNGFEALVELDNNTDGKIDANDTAYNQLRIWQDIDGDGYSTAEELHTLEELGIASINTGYTNTTTVDANGNEHKQTGTFTWADGTTSASEDVWFQQDKMYTIANDWVDVPEDIASLPDLQGFGNVRDLHQTMARERLAGGDTLKTLVEQFAAATDVTTRNSLINQIIYKWTGVEAVNPTSRGTVLDARKIAALEKLFAATGPASLSLYYRPNEASYIDKSYNGVYELIYSQLMAQTHLKDLFSTITYTWDETTQSVRGDLSAVITDIQNSLALDYEAGKTLLAEFSRTLKGVGAQDIMNYETYYQTFALQGQDLGLIIQAAGMSLITGTAGNNTLTGSQLLANLINGNDGNDTITGGLIDDIINGGAGNDIIYGYAGDDIIDGGIGNDTLYGEYGNDTYKFGIGSGQDTILDNDGGESSQIDTVEFGAGITINDIEGKKEGTNLRINIKGTTDSLLIQNGYTGGQYRIEKFKFSDGTILNGISMNIQGTAGNDTLSGSAGDDTLDGGAGNDTLNGGIGNDTYSFGIGSGADTISDYDTTVGNRDTIEFGEGITPTDLEFVKEGYHLKIKINGQTDTLLIQNWFNAATPADYRIEQLKFADGTLLTIPDIETAGYKIYGTTTSETLTGSNAKDIIDGGVGNDTLNGGVGNDILNGGTGNDTLNGGTGNDILNGGIGNDTYKFGIGSGSDTISDYTTDYATTTDKVEMGANSLNLILTKTSNNLTITNNTTTDQLTMQSWYSGAAYQTEEIQTADGKHLHNNQVAQLIQAMATFCTNNGVTWNQAIEQKPAEVQQVLAQYWSQS